MPSIVVAKDSALTAHTASTANPHAVTKAQVGLGSVTDVAQLPASYLDTDGTMAANSDAKVPSQQAVREYVAANAGGGGGAGVDYAASANSSGNTTITVDDVTGTFLAVTTFSGSGSTTRIMVLATGGSPIAGARIVHRCVLPATAEITVEWRNATSGGTLLTSALTDGSGDDAVAEFYFDGSAWQLLRFTNPANA